MRFDMHCHTKEGSLDGKVSLRDYVLRLKMLSYDGMLITDHNSYKAYRWYTRNADDPAFEGFTVLKGIEYDTCDGGHILVIMPTDVMFPILELRGLPVRLLIEIVHAFHGILGPAHPTGEKYLSLTNGKYYRRHPEVINEFDFMEVKNACVTEDANEKAVALAEKYHLPGTAGSDAHKLDCIGCASTEFDADISSESDLIEYIRSAAPIKTSEEHYPGTTRDHLGRFYDLLLRLFYIYNRVLNHRRHDRRLAELAGMLSSSPNLFLRIRKIFTGGGFQDIVQNSKDRERIRNWLDNSLFVGMSDEAQLTAEEVAVRANAGFPAGGEPQEEKRKDRINESAS